MISLALAPVRRQCLSADLTLGAIIKCSHTNGCTGIGCSLRILNFIFLTLWRFYVWLWPVFSKNSFLAFSCASRSDSRRFLVATLELYESEACGCWLEQWPPSCYHFSKTSSQWRQRNLPTAARLNPVWCARRRLGTFILLARSVITIFDFF